MPPMRTTVTIALMLLPLGGCGQFAKHVQFDAKPVSELDDPKAQPDPELAKDCNDPVDIPQGKMNAGAAERGWGQDRVSLVECKKRHQQLRDFYTRRDNKLACQANNSSCKANK